MLCPDVATTAPRRPRRDLQGLFAAGKAVHHAGTGAHLRFVPVYCGKQKADASSRAGIRSAFQTARRSAPEEEVAGRVCGRPERAGRRLHAHECELEQEAAEELGQHRTIRLMRKRRLARIFRQLSIKMLANTQKYSPAFINKICRRDSTPGIVRCCSGRKRRVANENMVSCVEMRRKGGGLFGVDGFKQEVTGCRKSLKTRFSPKTCAGRANTSYRKRKISRRRSSGTAAFSGKTDAEEGLCWKARRQTSFKTKIKAGGVRHEKGRRMEHGPGGTEEKGIGGKSCGRRVYGSGV